MLRPPISKQQQQQQPFLGERFALWYQTVVCLSVLSVTLAYCGQTFECIKIKLCMQIGLGPGQLGGDPAPLPMLWPNGWMN